MNPPNKMVQSQPNISPRRQLNKGTKTPVVNTKTPNLITKTSPRPTKTTTPTNQVKAPLRKSPSIKKEGRDENTETRTISNEQKKDVSKKDRRDNVPLTFTFREKQVPVTYNSNISHDIIDMAITSGMFQGWIEKTGRVFGSKSIELYGVEIESVHVVGGRVDCINMKVESDLIDEDESIQDKRIKEFCCLRDSSIGILVELNCVEDNTTWTVLVDQPRLNVGAVSALELPIGLLEKDNLIGSEVKEVENICNISLRQADLINLTQRAYENSCVYNSTGLCPSLGNCSEFIKIMYARKDVTAAEFKSIRKRLSKMREEGTPMTLRVVPLEDMWKVSADMKVVCALFLLERADLPEREDIRNCVEEENKGQMRQRLNNLRDTFTLSKKPSWFAQT